VLCTVIVVPVKLVDESFACPYDAIVEAFFSGMQQLFVLAKRRELFLVL
jgi:hypothetical protein